ncbi:uncharacterized protein LOC108904026 [Anoplophora glabripennis]|uniref:uncharacterized protein LOC108904026 n=1 Tax=Anoplophora glabripennis TaxID=217634 RepID=UPI0008740887|nr:uncharacterized protein LOC108904026 [Anoplophora glabripennis]
MLSSLPSWNPRAEFLIVCVEVVEKPHAVALNLSEVLWRKGIVKIAVLMPVANDQYQIYSRNPFKTPRHSLNTSPLGHCRLGTYHGKTPWSGPPLEECSNNCTLKVHYVDWPPLVLNAKMGLQPSNYELSQGFDMNILNIIANKLNLTVFYNTTGILWGKIYENGTTEGSFELLLRNTVDILIGGYSKTAERIKYFDITDSHIEVFQEWCVSNTPVMVGIRNISNIFRIEVWIAVVAVYFLVATCIYLSGRHNQHEFGTYRNIGNTLLTSFRVFLGMTVHALPRGTGTRYFISLLTIFGFYLTLYYSGYLTSIISAPKYVQKYNTLKDIYDYDLKTYFMPDDAKWILHDNSITSIVPSELIRKRWRNCRNMSWCFEIVATSEATSFYTDNLHKDYFLASHSRSMHCIRYNKIGTPVGIVLRKGFPFYTQFNLIINRIFEAGIILKWRRDIFKPKISALSKGDTDSSIKFKNLKPIFKFLLVSSCISLVVFLIEVVVHKLNF